MQERTQQTAARPPHHIQDLGQLSGELSGQGPFVQAPTVPELVVLISQHSSFEREEYLRYHSSLSSTNTASSILQHQDSGLGESSPPSESSIPDKLEREGVIPDSQSLPDSSSYIPTSSTSQSVRSFTQAETGNRVVVASSWTISTNSSASHPVSSYSPTRELSDSIEDSSDPLPEESQSLGAPFSRSRSLPLGALTGASGRDQTGPKQISGHTLDPSAILDGRRIHIAPELSTELIVTSSVVEVPSSSDFYTQTQASSVLGITESHSQSEIQELSGYQPIEGQSSGITSLEDRRGFQVDFNRAHVSQETRTSSIPSAGKLVASTHS